METHHSSASRLLRSLQKQIDELIVQLSLGKAEASQNFEHAKAAFREKLISAREVISQDDTRHNLAAKLDHLRIQLSLGGMESRDAYHEQREKILHAIKETKDELHYLEERVRDDLHESADTLQLKLNALALNLGVAAIIAEDELKTRREELSVKAERVSGKLKSAIGAVGAEAEILGKEAREAFEDISDNLKRLLH